MKRKVWMVLCALAPAWALAAFSPAAAPAAVSAFLEAEGFEGESTNAKFQKAIDVLSWSWGVTNPGGKPFFTSFSIQKNLDRTSPKLMEYAGTAQVIPRAKLRVIKVGGDQQEFLRYCFAGVRVVSIQQSGTGGDSISESMSFSYEHIVQRYSQQDPDGSLRPPVFGGFDTVKNLILPPGDC
jgi:type VI secretion system secreted protein Hcp